VNTSTTAVYSLFGGKPGLLNAVYDEAFARFGERLGSVVPTGDPVTDLAALGQAYRASALAEPHFYQVMFGPLGGVMTPEPESVERGLATSSRCWTRCAGRSTWACCATRTRSPSPPRCGRRCTGWSPWSCARCLPEGSGDPAEMYRTAFRALVYGWRATSGAQRSGGDKPGQ